MGGIRDRFGRITIESRRESFIVHADYGYRSLRVQRHTLLPGEYFKYPEGETGPYRVKSIDEDHLYTETFRADRDDEWVVPCYSDGEPVDVEENLGNGFLGRHWREQSDPEFLNEDLLDLIAALRELQENPR